MKFANLLDIIKSVDIVTVEWGAAISISIFVLLFEILRWLRYRPIVRISAHPQPVSNDSNWTAKLNIRISNRGGLATTIEQVHVYEFSDCSKRDKFWFLFWCWHSGRRANAIICSKTASRWHHAVKNRFDGPDTILLTDAYSFSLESGSQWMGKITQDKDLTSSIKHGYVYVIVFCSHRQSLLSKRVKTKGPCKRVWFIRWPRNAILTLGKWICKICCPQKNQPITGDIMERPFNAVTQYGDFRGTAAADGYMSYFNVQTDLQKLGVEIGENESLAGISLSLGEIMRPHKYHAPITPYVTVFLESQEKPGLYRPIRLNFVTLEDFVRIFKRFEVRISPGGVMDNKTYPDYDPDIHPFYDIDSAKLDELV